MKLVTFYVKAVKPAANRIGALDKNGNIVDLAVAYRAMRNAGDKMDQKFLDKLASVLIPTDMVEFIQGGDSSLEAARAALAYAEEFGGEGICYTPDEVQLRAPIPRPAYMRDMLCFMGHFYHPMNDKMVNGFLHQPLYYKAATTTVVGPDDTVVWPRFTEGSYNEMDFETEYGCVIGKPCHNVTPEEVDDYIFGYVNFNDFSARDQQRIDGSGGLSFCKGKDFATGIGPYLVTKDEIEDVYNMPMRMYVNGKLVVEGNTGKMTRSWADNIAYLSQDDTLLPGEVLGSGTVESGAACEGVCPFLKDGDVVEEEVGPMGRLRNVISAPADAPLRNNYSMSREEAFSRVDPKIIEQRNAFMNEQAKRQFEESAAK